MRDCARFINHCSALLLLLKQQCNQTERYCLNTIRRHGKQQVPMIPCTRLRFRSPCVKNMALAGRFGSRTDCDETS